MPALGDFVPAGGAAVRGSRATRRRSADDDVPARVVARPRAHARPGRRLRLPACSSTSPSARWPTRRSTIPTTAVQAIDRLHDCLRQLARRAVPGRRAPRRRTASLRLVVPVMDWDAYVHLAFDEIRRVGARSPQVARRLVSALEDLRTVALPERVAGARPAARDPRRGRARRRLARRAAGAGLRARPGPSGHRPGGRSPLTAVRSPPPAGRRTSTGTAGRRGRAHSRGSRRRAASPGARTGVRRRRR